MYHSSAVSLNHVNNAILRARVGPNAGRIDTVNHPLNRTADSLLNDWTQSALDVLMSIWVIIAMSFVPASFLLYLVGERTTKVKHMQLVSGTSPATYWVATYVWDCALYMVPCFVVVGIFATIGGDS